MTVNDIDISTIIEDKWEMYKYKKDGKFTKTTQFLLPSIELEITPKFLKYFLNSFLEDVDYEHAFTNPLFVLFKYTKSKEWSQLYGELLKNKNYRIDYNLGSKDGWDLIMVVFEIDSKFRGDYLSFKKGKYSEFSIEYKKKFPRYIVSGGKKEESTIWQIIHKSKDLRDEITEDLGLFPNTLDENDELWEVPRKDTEFYNYANN